MKHITIFLTIILFTSFPLYAQEEVSSVDFKLLDEPTDISTVLPKAYSITSFPLWSPEGDRFIFETDDGEYQDLWLYAPEGGKLTRLTTERECARLKIMDLNFSGQYRWSSDGQILSFVSSHEMNYDIFIYNFRKKNYRQFTHDRSWDGTHAWAPDGHHIAFLSTRSANVDLWMKKIDRWRFSRAKQLTRSKEIDFCPTFSPDSKMLAFSGYRNKNYDIYLLNVESHAVRRLTAMPAKEVFPSYSPMEDRLAFYQDDKLISMNSQGLDFKLIDTGVRIEETGPSWTANGQYLVYVKVAEPHTVYCYDLSADKEYSLKLTGIPENMSLRAPALSPKVDWAVFWAVSHSKPRQERLWLSRIELPMSQELPAPIEIKLPLGQSLSWSDVVGLESEPEGGEGGESGESGAEGGDF